MPRPTGNKSRQDRDAGGMFAPTHPALDTVSDEESDDNVWESDIESETETDTDYFEAWETMPVPRTYDERAQRNTEKREKAAEKRRIAEMRSAERREAGTTNNQQDIPAPGGSAAKRPRREVANLSAASSSVAIREEEEESSASGEESGLASDESEVEDEIDIAPEELEEQARQADGDTAVDSIVVADDIAEWIDTVLDDAARESWMSFGLLPEIV
ncbi:hypothetical protein B0H13DRAFT_2339437 [Mycena leptocephala]|nr:hypothetical protein B0H13DRAFT_2339437 [Mycena leptocephala]